MHLRLIFIFFISFCSFFSIADTQRVPLEVYADVPTISLMTISPDGSRIAYKTVQNDRAVLLVKDIATDGILGGAVLEGINANHAYFIDNFRVILKAFEYKKIQGYRGLSNVSVAFIYDLRTKEIRQLLIPGHGIYKGQTAVGNIVGLSPDMKHAFMPAYYSQLKGVTVNDFGEGPKYSLMKVSLGSKRIPREMRIGAHDAVDFFVDELGAPLVRERYNQTDSQHQVQSYIDGKWVTIFSETTPFRYRSFSGLTADRKNLVMTTTGENGRRQYFTMSLQDGTISETMFSRDDADIEEVLTDIQRVVYGVKYSGFKPSYAFFDTKLTKTFNAIQNAMPESTFTMIDHTPDWSKIIFKIEGGQQSGEYVLFGNGGFSLVGSSRPKVTAAIVNPVMEYNYKTRDGYTIPTLLTYPVNSANTKAKLPAVVLPHGGPESYDKIQFDWLAQHLASRGILVIQPQFRGSKGFGIAHLQAGRGEWGKKIQDDISDAVFALTEANKIDPERVCIMGWSYGGYAALAGVSFTPELYKCAISINGISDVEQMLTFEKKVHGEQSETYRYWQEVINTRQLQTDFLSSISPINHIKHIDAPILLIHGSRDKVVDIEQSVDFFAELKDAGKDVQLVEIEDEGHTFIKSQSRLKTLKAIDEFLHTHLL